MLGQVTRRAAHHDHAHRYLLFHIRLLLPALSRLLGGNLTDCFRAAPRLGSRETVSEGDRLGKESAGQSGGVASVPGPVGVVRVERCESSANERETPTE